MSHCCIFLSLFLFFAPQSEPPLQALHCAGAMTCGFLPSFCTNLKKDQKHVLRVKCGSSDTQLKCTFCMHILKDLHAEKPFTLQTAVCMPVDVNFFLLVCHFDYNFMRHQSICVHGHFLKSAWRSCMRRSLWAASWGPLRSMNSQCVRNNCVCNCNPDEMWKPSKVTSATTFRGEHTRTHVHYHSHFHTQKQTSVHKLG